MHFGENQLSPSLIGLSPLATGHPPSFQPRWVRPSTKSYLRFSLPMASSLGFGSTACDSTPYSDSLSLRLPLAGSFFKRHAITADIHHVSPISPEGIMATVEQRRFDCL